jgi:hypothetical protein
LKSTGSSSLVSSILLNASSTMVVSYLSQLLRRPLVKPPFIVIARLDRARNLEKHWIPALRVVDSIEWGLIYDSFSILSAS